MKNIIFRTLILFAIWLPLSCVDRLDYLVDTDVGQLVIYGLVTDQQDIHRVNVSRTNDFGMPPIGTEGAMVSLLLENGARIFYTDKGGGVYELQDYKPSEGQTMALEVIIDENIYRSNFETMPKMVGQDKISFSFSFEPFRSSSSATVFTVFAETQIPETTEPVFLRWQVEETYIWFLTQLPCHGLCPPPPKPCFISDVMESGRLTLFDGSSSSTRKTFQVLGKRVADDSFLFPFFAIVRQLSLNRETFQYWEKVKLVTNNQGSLFDAPPAPILGNFRNVNDHEEIVLGYFEVAKETITRLYTTPADLPFFKQSPCTFVLGKERHEYPEECFNCDIRARGRNWSNTAPQWFRFD